MPMKTIHRCGRCLLRDEQSGQCSILKMVVAENQDACPRYADEGNVITCELCGRRTVVDNSVIYNEERVHLVCGDCADKSGTCYTCLERKTCPFETDPSPLPKVVQRRIQQGPMVEIAQIKNPERINITCRAGCPCWDEESFTCGKEQGWCCSYKIVWE